MRETYTDAEDDLVQLRKKAQVYFRHLCIHLNYQALCFNAIFKI